MLVLYRPSNNNVHRRRVQYIKTWAVWLKFGYLSQWRFYRAACNADAVLWGVFCPSVRSSVCPSVRHTRDPWQNGRKICPDLYTIRKNIYPSFLRRRMVDGGKRTLLHEIFGQPAPVWAKSPILNRHSLVALSAPAPSEKVQLTLIGSPLRAFQ